MNRHDTLVLGLQIGAAIFFCLLLYSLRYYILISLAMVGAYSLYRLSNHGRPLR